MEKTAKHFYRRLFGYLFFISMSTFGGGFVIISLMKKKFCDELNWISRDDILNLTAIAQSAPGSLAVNASILLGYQLKGLKGALVAVLATILPPLIILSLISVFYNAFSNNQIIQIALKVMRAGVAAVIFDVVINLMKDVLKTRNALDITVMVAAFAASYFVKVDTIMIILICLALAVGLELLGKNKGAA